jgi:hypothetical protein
MMQALDMPIATAFDLVGNFYSTGILKIIHPIIIIVMAPSFSTGGLPIGRYDEGLEQLIFQLLF